MFNDEFNQKFSGRYYGKYRGVVIRSNDPKEEGRLMLKVPVIMGTETVGWCKAAQGGGEDTGSFDCPENGDFVWVEFEEGDPSRPIWSSGPWGMRNGESMLPKHGRGEPDDLDFSIRDQGNIPPSQFAGSYTNVKIIRSKSGSLLEFDSTSGQERVQLAHKTGTRLEMLADGSLEQVSTANYKARIEGQSNVEVGGDNDVFIGGNRTVIYDKDVNETISGDLTQTLQQVTRVGKSLSDTWEGSQSTECGGKWEVKANSQGAMSFGGQLSFMVGKNLQATVMEGIELAASNATNVIPIAPAITIHGYNGNVVLKATDPLGMINEANITLVGNTTPGTPMIKLGGDLAVQPIVLGTVLMSLLTTLLTDLATHTHPTGVGPSGPPVTAAAYTALLGQLSTALSLEAFVK